MARHRNLTFASAIRLAHRLRWLGLERHLYWPAWQRRMERLERRRLNREFWDRMVQIHPDNLWFKAGQHYQWDRQQWVSLNWDRWGDRLAPRQ